jgi:hypothetical protein
VSQINVITRINVQAKYAHSRMKPFCTLNNLEDTVSQLPNMHALGNIAYIRSTNEHNKKLYGYRPSVVLKAVQWLKTHNRVFKDIDIVLNDTWANTAESEYTVDGLLDLTVEGDEADEFDKVVEDELQPPAGSDATAVHIEDEFIVPLAVAEPTDVILMRKKGAPTWRAKDPDWVYKAFPWLFPFGVGFTERIPIREYIKVRNKQERENRQR